MSTPASNCDSVIIPDLVNMAPFRFLINPLDSITSPASDRWLEAPGTLTTRKMRTAQRGLNAGLLGSMCWPELENQERLQVCADYVNYLFHLDDLTDEMDAKNANIVREAVIDVMDNPEKWADKIERGEAHAISILILWMRIRKVATPLVQQRFRDTFDDFFVAITDEAVDRKNKVILGVQDYIYRRRENGAVRPCFVLIEYANGFELPEHVWHHSSIRNLEDWADDLVSWANDVLSFGVEYGRGDTSNIVISVMNERGVGIQEAMDVVGKMFTTVVEDFLTERNALPPWGPNIDRHVQLYIQGLEDWIMGSTEWCFWTKRYFEDGMQVRNTRVLEFQHPRRK
ncbi:terpenoid synthase [Calocera viscosa TUFC12733]|uniref:Terpene synthase n=1 Tax=Calocera viscosa (strain TUFC12733) TaxID=1330018 RepID=A0A167KCI7_CALVF|nr:terpenoid synthase [Calocera viscosa TUFC12733]